MLRFKGLFILLIFLGAPLIASTVETHFYYWALTPNDLGETRLGGRLGWHHVELTVENLSGLSGSLAVYQNINEKGRIIPRVSLGIRLFGTSSLASSGVLTLIPGVGVTFPLINLFGGKVGVGWDYYVSVTSYAGKVTLSPFIPLTLAFYFK